MRDTDVIDYRRLLLGDTFYGETGNQNMAALVFLSVLFALSYLCDVRVVYHEGQHLYCVHDIASAFHFRVDSKREGVLSASEIGGAIYGDGGVCHAVS